MFCSNVLCEYLLEHHKGQVVEDVMALCSVMMLMLASQSLQKLWYNFRLACLQNSLLVMLLQVLLVFIVQI